MRKHRRAASEQKQSAQLHMGVRLPQASNDCFILSTDVS
jgi:hypothetical protein